ncbi:MAG: hypothetical protein INQ03_14110 [Candidatus Heimdallarchaeota archaeon]|nr:hypothetical protein [Candidatus Heimdallarchaeota archaeon]
MAQDIEEEIEKAPEKIEDLSVEANRVKFFRNRYLNEYIDKIEEVLRFNSYRVDRSEIIGHLMEKLASQQVNDIKRSNGTYRIEKVLGPVSEMKQQFLQEKRRFFRETLTKEEKKQEDEEEKLKLAEMTKSERAKYKVRKNLSAINVKDKKFTLNIQESNARLLMAFSLITNIAFLILNIVLIIMSWDMLNSFMNAYTNYYYDQYYLDIMLERMHYMSELFFWNPGNLILIESLVFLNYVFVSVVFRNSSIELFGYKKAKSWIKYIKLIYISSLIRVILVGILAYFGAQFTTTVFNGYFHEETTVTGFTPDETQTIITIISIINLVSILWMMILCNVREEYEDQLSQYSQLRVNMARTFKMLFNLPSQLGIYLITMISSVIGLVSIFSLVIFLQLGGEVVTIFYSRNINYQFAFFTAVVISLHFLVGKLSIDQALTLIIKKRVKRQLILQLIFQTIFNAFLLIQANYIEEQVNQGYLDLYYYSFTFAEALISTIVYYVTTIALLVTNYYLFRSLPLQTEDFP